VVNIEFRAGLARLLDPTWSCEGRSQPRWIDGSAGDAEAKRGSAAISHPRIGAGEIDFPRARALRYSFPA
jgi:hypothetical protein